MRTCDNSTMTQAVVFRNSHRTTRGYNNYRPWLFHTGILLFLVICMIVQPVYGFVTIEYFH